MEGRPMPRGKRKGESLSGWFRQYFRTHPYALRKGRNDMVVTAWVADHPGQEFTGRLRQAMANVKSAIKNKKGGRRKAASAAAEPASARPARATGSLESLEMAIDRCLTTARAVEDKDPDMGKIARHLRFASNEVIWVQGQAQGLDNKPGFSEKQGSSSDQR